MTSLALLLLIWIPTGVPANVDSLYLHAGEVVLVEGRRARTATSTGGNVVDAALSPDGRLLVYEEVLHWVPAHGLFAEDEAPGAEAIGALVVVERESGRPVARLEPAEDWIIMDRWLGPDRLLLHAAGGFDVTAFFTFDAGTRTLRQLDYEEGGELLRAERERSRPLRRDPPPPSRVPTPRPPVAPGTILVRPSYEPLAPPEPAPSRVVTGVLVRPAPAATRHVPPPLLVVVYDPETVAAWEQDSGVPVAPVMAYPAAQVPPTADADEESPCYHEPGLWPCRLADPQTSEAERLRMVRDSLERLGFAMGTVVSVLTPGGVVELRVAAHRYGRGTCGVPESVALGLEGAGTLPPGSYYGTADRVEAVRWAARSVRPPGEPVRPAWLEAAVAAHVADVEARVRDYFGSPDTFHRGGVRIGIVPFRTADGLRWAVSVLYDDWVPFRSGAVYDTRGTRVEERATGWTAALDLDGDMIHDAFLGERTLQIVRGGAPWRAVEPGQPMC